MKHLMKLTTALMLLFAGLGLAACGDDDEGGSASGIVGTWRCDYNEEYYAYEIIELRADGTGTFTYGYVFNGQVQPDTESFKYTYDAEKELLHVTYMEDGDEEDVISASLSGDKLILDGEEYTRVK